MEIGNRNTDNIKIATENASLCGKICDMRSLLKYAKKTRQYAKCAAIVYSRKTDMPS